MLICVLPMEVDPPEVGSKHQVEILFICLDETDDVACEDQGI